MSCANHDEGKRKIKSVSIRSEDKCFCCRSSTGQLVSCSFCPKSFHASCLPEGISTTKPRWGCPSHKCSVCGMGTSKGRGKLYRCVGCPLAWCYDHLEKEHKPYNGNPFESLGLRVGSYAFVFCARCRDDTEVRMEMHNLEEELLESGSEEERSCKRMKNARGQAKKARRTYPDQQLVDEVKRFMKEYSKLQKDVAQDIGASESVLSQYMHGVQRSNGWNVLENKLIEWMEAVKAAEVPATPLPASPNRKRKFSEVAGKFDGLDSPRESYYSDSDFSTSPSHDQVYVQPTNYTPAALPAQSQAQYYQSQTQQMQSQQRPQQQQQQSQQQAYSSYMQQFWANQNMPAVRASFSNGSNAPAYSSYPYYSQEAAYYESMMHQQQQPVSHHSHWMPTEHNFPPQPITATRDGQSVYYL